MPKPESGLTNDEQCWIELGGWHYRIIETTDITFLVERRVPSWDKGYTEKVGEAQTPTMALELMKLKATLEQMYGMEVSLDAMRRAV